MGECRTVYVYLLEESTDVWRPVLSEQVGRDQFRLSGPVPADEHWQYQPGEVVGCEERVLSGGLVLVAVEGSSAEPRPTPDELAR
jgi:hypothetical protein